MTRSYTIREAGELLARPNRHGKIKPLTSKYVRDLLRFNGLDTVPFTTPDDRRVKVGVTQETLDRLRELRGLA